MYATRLSRRLLYLIPICILALLMAACSSATYSSSSDAHTSATTGQNTGTGASADASSGTGASADADAGPGASAEASAGTGASAEANAGPGASADANAGPGASADANAGPGASADANAGGNSTMLSVKFACSSTKDGIQVSDTQAKVCVKTSPGANLRLEMRFCEGSLDPSRALQGTAKADANGFYQWIWKPQADCNGQSIWSYKATVRAELNGHKATAEAAKANP